MFQPMTLQVAFIMASDSTIDIIGGSTLWLLRLMIVRLVGSLLQAFSTVECRVPMKV